MLLFIPNFFSPPSAAIFFLLGVGVGLGVGVTVNKNFAWGGGLIFRPLGGGGGG